MTSQGHLTSQNLDVAASAGPKTAREKHLFCNSVEKMKVTGVSVFAALLVLVAVWPATFQQRVVTLLGEFNYIFSFQISGSA